MIKFGLSLDPIVVPKARTEYEVLTLSAEPQNTAAISLDRFKCPTADVTGCGNLISELGRPVSDARS